MAAEPVIHRPLGHHRVISGCSFLLLFAAFVLFLLVALSLPIIKTVFILVLRAKVSPSQPATSIGTELRFGVWGVCVNSALDVPTLLDGSGDCTKPALGYTIPTEYLALLGLSPSLVSVLLKALEVLLVLHPVSAGLSLLTFLQALFLGNHGVSIFALVLCILTAIVSSVTLAADIALVVVAKQKLKDLTVVAFEVDFGNAVWMCVAAVALTWITVIFLSARACYCMGVRSSWKEYALSEKRAQTDQFSSQNASHPYANQGSYQQQDAYSYTAPTQQQPEYPRSPDTYSSHEPTFPEPQHASGEQAKGYGDYRERY